MADDARAWAESNGQQAEGGYGPQSCLICTREQLAAADTEPPAIHLDLAQVDLLPLAVHVDH
jgi:hypothetical protein